MLMNNLDPDVAERPQDLVVYGGTGKAARDWPSFHALVRELERLENDETLLVASGKPVGVFRTHEDAPRVLIANSNLVGHWSNWEHFHALEKLGLIMYGQMTAGSWIYIGTQGILQGTYETFAAAARKHFGGSLAGKLVVTGGMGGMGGAQPLVAQLHAAPLQIHSMVRRLDQLAVHPHPTRFNPASRLAPRSQPRLRQNPVGCLQRPMPAILFAPRHDPALRTTSGPPPASSGYCLRRALTAQRRLAKLTPGFPEPPTPEWLLCRAQRRHVNYDNPRKKFHLL